MTDNRRRTESWLEADMTKIEGSQETWRRITFHEFFQGFLIAFYYDLFTTNFIHILQDYFTSIITFIYCILCSIGNIFPWISPAEFTYLYTGVHMAPIQAIYQHMPYSDAAMLCILKK